MGFKTVYNNLLELFPQVDSRILKAVAIEHPKDADAAADVVISDVLPYLARQSTVDSPPAYRDSKPSSSSNGKAQNEENDNSLRSDRAGSSKTGSFSLESSSTDKEYTCGTYLGSPALPSDSTCQGKTEGSNTQVSFDPNNSTNKLQGDTESEDLILLVRPHHEDSIQSGAGQTSEFMSNMLLSEGITNHVKVCGANETEVPASLGKSQDDNVGVEDEQTFQDVSTSLTQESGECEPSLTACKAQWKDFDGPSLQDDHNKCEKSSLIVPCVDGGKSPQSEPFLNCTYLDVENVVVEGTHDAAAVDIQSEVSDSPTNSRQNLKFNQDIKIDFLEDVVEAAKNNKKTLFLAMDTIMNMMREVELQEKAAEEAKEEASSAGLDILAKADELKQTLTRAQEANDMHAGEVYGERAILATEVRELQARLLSLSDERDSALAIIDEMRQSLEQRLAAAEELKKTAEKQKLEQEEAAQNVLAEQEAIMEKVVQESKMLQQEAAENSKLREFLMDRGCIVDTLQGEISVICQDVRLLKEKFDERIPLSKSISSSQTSCILASSGSSLKSISSDLALETRETAKSSKERSPASSIDGRSLKSPEERSPTSSITDQSRKSETMTHEARNPKALLDDDWEFFE